jgi:hypothetical protein
MEKIDLTDLELLEKTKTAAASEKEATLELLRYLVRVDERRAYATLACSSLFEYVHKILGYSEMQTSERVNSVRLMRAVPEVESKIESGSLSMSTASQVQRFLRTEKKVGNPVSDLATLEIIDSCAGHSKREVEKTLLGLSSEEAVLTVERVKAVSENLTELKFLITDSTHQKLEEIKNLMGNESLRVIFDQSLDVLLREIKKINGRETKSTFPGKEEVKTEAKTGTKTPSAKNVDESLFSSQKPFIRSRFIPIAMKRKVSARSGGQCEFVDQTTNERCNSRYCLEFDHYPVPFSLGGEHSENNLRHACKAHNLKFGMDLGLVK